MPSPSGPRQGAEPSPDDAEPEELDHIPSPSVSPADDAPVVLVVDDDPDVRTLVVRTLGRTYTVYEAQDGEQARSLLEVIPVPDGVVCDVMMPGIDGLALAAWMRRDPLLKRVPLLFLTARDGPMDVIAGINAGAKHYVTKPFKIQDLVAKVDGMTRRTKGR